MGLRDDAQQLALQLAELAHQGTNLTKSAGQQRVLETAHNFVPFAETLLLAVDNAEALSRHNVELMDINAQLTSYLTDIGHVLKAMFPDGMMSEALAAYRAQHSQLPQAAKVEKAYRRSNAESAAAQAEYETDPSGHALRRRYARPPDPWPTVIRHAVNGADLHKPKTRGRPKVPPYHPEA